MHKTGKDDTRTNLSIVIPAMDEQATVNQTIEAISHQTFSGRFEIIVVDGRPDKSTISCIENTDVVKMTAPPGRAAQMNAGARQASGEILLFLHCDTKLPDGALESIKGLMENRSVKAGAYDLKINAKGFLFRLIEKTASVRSRLTRIPYGDQAIFIRKTYFDETGQYREIPIMEDVDLMGRIKKQKEKIHIFRRPVLTSARRWEKEGILYCTLRNWLIITFYFLGMKPEKFALFYQSGNS